MKRYFEPSTTQVELTYSVNLMQSVPVSGADPNTEGSGSESGGKMAPRRL